ncbi:hypothetical protein VPNG_04576 [Cytospora leucostoma]|uniref:Uncharacterized protein n=1 Tax=Cytospora leucostoma TaxID=1230097 RepID=A0A423XCK6_9PEZI|nr:hypothetical protein VPNG_04576 [Cytospora leucostoma]
MAIAKRKRTSSEDTRPSKKVKNFAPAFYDRLSTVSLTKRALLELNRRNDTQTKACPPHPTHLDRDIHRFARHGGPDLSGLRGFPAPYVQPTHTMATPSSSKASRRSGPSKSSRIPRQTDTETDITSIKSKKSSAYDANFEAHLIDNGIFPPGYHSFDRQAPAGPSNRAEIRERLNAPRASPSPTPSDYDRFIKANDQALTEAKMTKDVVELFLCGEDRDIASQDNMRFTNLRSITQEATVTPQPDLFDGAPRRQVHAQVRRDLERLIVPTKEAQAPIAPNFFHESKPENGNPTVAKRQITYDLSVGARAMEALRNYNREPSYDGNAYALGSTYHGEGVLHMYAAHMVAGSGGQETFVGRIGIYSVADSVHEFRRGIRAFRNARDLAREFRDNIILTANSRVEQEETGEQRPETEDQPVDRAEHDDEASNQGSTSLATSFGAVTSQSVGGCSSGKRRERSSPSPSGRETRSRRASQK